MTDVAASMGRVFISYRREETAYAAGWLFDRLVDRFGRGQIFKDVDSIEPGDDFVEVINTAVGSCDVLLALIGDQWLTITGDDGRRRLDDPADFVRLEIEAALTRNVRVIPILVEGARMPDTDELPATLSKLIRRQALELSPSRFDFDTGRLFTVLDRALAEAHPRATVTEPLLTSGGGRPPAGAGGAPSRDPAGVEQDRWRRKRPWVLTATAAGAVVVAAGVIGAVVLLPSDGSGDTDSQGTDSTERTVEIPGAEAWTDTHVECSAGEVLEIEASGTVVHDTVTNETVSPDGLVDPWYHQFNVPGLPDANTVALIGSIDRAQPYFVVGSGTTYECPSAGGLFLGINDVGLANNGGEFIATIRQRDGS